VPLGINLFATIMVKAHSNSVLYLPLKINPATVVAALVTVTIHLEDMSMVDMVVAKQTIPRIRMKLSSLVEVLVNTRRWRSLE
jgi:hypothetical protein